MGPICLVISTPGDPYFDPLGSRFGGTPHYDIPGFRVPGGPDPGYPKSGYGGLGPQTWGYPKSGYPESGTPPGDETGCFGDPPGY